MPTRFLKESICTSSEIDPLSEAAEVLFYRLMVNCDDYGRMDARPSIVASRCYPLRRQITDEQIVARLGELVTTGLVLVYVDEDRPYLEIVKFTDHQPPRASKSKYPDSSGKAVVSNCMQLLADENGCARISSFDVRSSYSYATGAKRPARSADPVWDALAEEFGEPATRTEKTKRGKTVRELREIGATPVEIHARCAEHRRRWVGKDVTETSLVKHWTHLGRDGPQTPATEPKGFAALRRVRETTGGDKPDDVRRVGTDRSRASRRLPAAGDPG